MYSMMVQWLGGPNDGELLTMPARRTPFGLVPRDHEIVVAELESPTSAFFEQISPIEAMPIKKRVCFVGRMAGGGATEVCDGWRVFWIDPRKLS